MLGTAIQRSGGMQRPSWEAFSSTLQSRSSSVRVNDGTGASAPNTLPTNWAGSQPTGLTRTVGVGLWNGLEYVEINWVGTAGSTAAIVVTDESASQIAALSGQSWTYSGFVAAPGVTGISALNIDVQGTDGVSQTELFATDIFASLSASFMRFSRAATLANVGTTHARGRWRTNAINSGSAVNVTLRIGRTMFHRGSVALSPLRTSGVARSGVHVSAGQ